MQNMFINLSQLNLILNLIEFGLFNTILILLVNYILC